MPKKLAPAVVVVAATMNACRAVEFHSDMLP